MILVHTGWNSSTDVFLGQKVAEIDLDHLKKAKIRVRKAQRRPCRLRGVPTPYSCRISSPRFNAPT